MVNIGKFKQVEFVENVLPIIKIFRPMNIKNKTFCVEAFLTKGFALSHGKSL